MNAKYLQDRLAAHLREISGFLKSLPEEYLHLSPDHRWTIAEELWHLMKSNAGTARLLSQPKDQLRPTTQSSRAYDDLIQEYQQKYAAASAPRGPKGSQPDNVRDISKETTIAQWSETSQALLEHTKGWPEAEWSKYTIWKHPLLGVLTVQEMLFFTAYHNEHHGNTVKEKYSMLSSNNRSGD